MYLSIEHREKLSNVYNKCYIVVFLPTKQWVCDFVELVDMVQGYQRKYVTPYMHIMVLHVLATSSSFLDRVSKHLISIFALFLCQMAWRRTKQ